jgi:hypothetical protein
MSGELELMSTEAVEILEIFYEEGKKTTKE